MKRSEYILLVLVSTVLAASMWFFVNHVMIAHQRSEAAQSGRPRGNLSDLYPRWLGARELLLHHRNPYSPEITREIQIGYYGRPLDAARPFDPKDQQAFAYPVYVTLLLAPTVKLPFEIVRRGFAWVLAGLTAASVWLWLRALRWRPGWAVGSAIVILTLGSFQNLQGIKLQQLSLVVAALVAAGVALIVADWLWLAGILFAVSTIKPQLVVLLCIFLLIWTLSDWPKRRRLAFGFGVTMALLLAGAQLLLPTWISDFWRATQDYRRYTGGQSILDVVLPSPLGKAVAAVAVLGLAVAIWRFRRIPATSPVFALIVALVLAITLLVIPMFALYNQLLLLPVVLVALRDSRMISRRRNLFRIAGVAATLFIGWAWIAAFGLTVASVFLRSETVQRAWAIPLWGGLGIPGTCLLLLAPLLADAWQSPTAAGEAVQQAAKV